MGTGVATGEERAVLAAQQAINSPLLQDTSIKGAKNLLLHIAGPSDMKMNEMVSTHLLLNTKGVMECLLLIIIGVILVE